MVTRSGGIRESMNSFPALLREERMLQLLLDSPGATGILSLRVSSEQSNDMRGIRFTAFVRDRPHDESNPSQ